VYFLHNNLNEGNARFLQKPLFQKQGKYLLTYPLRLWILCINGYTLETKTPIIEQHLHLSGRGGGFFEDDNKLSVSLQ
jgi:hypothetical protein